MIGDIAFFDLLLCNEDHEMISGSICVIEVSVEVMPSIQRRGNDSELVWICDSFVNSLIALNALEFLVHEEQSFSHFNYCGRDTVKLGF